MQHDSSKQKSRHAEAASSRCSGSIPRPAAAAAAAGAGGNCSQTATTQAEAAEPTATAAAAAGREPYSSTLSTAPASPRLGKPASPENEAPLLNSSSSSSSSSSSNRSGSSSGSSSSSSSNRSGSSSGSSSSSSSSSSSKLVGNSNSRLLSSTNTCRVPILLKGDADCFVAVNVGGLVGVPFIQQQQDGASCCSPDVTGDQESAKFLVSATLFVDGNRVAPPCLLLPPTQQQHQQGQQQQQKWAACSEEVQHSTAFASGKQQLELWPRPCLHSLIGYSSCSADPAPAAAPATAVDPDADARLMQCSGRRDADTATKEGGQTAADTGTDITATAADAAAAAEPSCRSPPGQANKEAVGKVAGRRNGSSNSSSNSNRNSMRCCCSGGRCSCMYCGINYVSLQQLLRLPVKVSALPLNALLLFGVYVHDGLAAAAAATAAAAEVTATGDGWRLFGIALMPLHDAAACVKQGRQLLPIHLLQHYLPLLPLTSRSSRSTKQEQCCLQQQQALAALRDSTLPLSLQRLQCSAPVSGTTATATSDAAGATDAAAAEPFGWTEESVLSLLCSPSGRAAAEQQHQKKQQQQQSLLERVEIEAAAVRCCRLLHMLQSGVVPPAAETLDAAAQQRLQEQLQQHLLLLQQLAQADYEEVWRQIAAAAPPGTAAGAAAATTAATPITAAPAAATGAAAAAPVRVPFGGFLYVEAPSYGLPVLHGELRLLRSSAAAPFGSGGAGLQQQRQPPLLLQQPVGVSSKMPLPFLHPPRIHKTHAVPPVAPAEAAKLLLQQQQQQQQEELLQKRQQQRAEHMQQQLSQLKQTETAAAARPPTSSSSSSATTGMETAPSETATPAAAAAVTPSPRNWLSRSWGIAPLVPVTAAPAPASAPAGAEGSEAKHDSAVAESRDGPDQRQARTADAATAAAATGSTPTGHDSSENNSAAIAADPAAAAASGASEGPTIGSCALELGAGGVADEEGALQQQQQQLEQQQQQYNWKQLLRNPSVAERLQRRLLLHDASWGVTHPAAARAVQAPLHSSASATAGQLPPAAVTRAFQRSFLGGGFSGAASREERALLWAYRHHLMRMPFALPRLLQIVDWNSSTSSSSGTSSSPQQQEQQRQQQQEALDLLQDVDASLLSVEDILGLLLFSTEVEPAAAAAAAGGSGHATAAASNAEGFPGSGSSSSSIAAAVHAKVKMLAAQGIDAAPAEEVLFFMQQLVQLIRSEATAAVAAAVAVAAHVGVVDAVGFPPFLLLLFSLQSADPAAADPVVPHIPVANSPAALGAAVAVSQDGPACVLQRGSSVCCFNSPQRSKSAPGADFVLAAAVWEGTFRQRRRRLYTSASADQRQHHHHQGHEQQEDLLPLHPRVRQQAEMADKILRLLERQRLCRDGFQSLFPLVDQYEGTDLPQVQQQQQQLLLQNAEGSLEGEALATDGGVTQTQAAAAVDAATTAAETAELEGAPAAVDAGPAVGGAAGAAAAAATDGDVAASGGVSLVQSLLHACMNEPSSAADAQATADAAAAAAAEFGIPLPFDSSSVLLHIVAEDCYVMKSSQYPLVIKALIYEQQQQQQQQQGVLRLQRFLYKADDDLRQDVLMLQLIGYMDRVLRLYGLDLKLTPYKASTAVELSMLRGVDLCLQVVAFSASDGLIEFLEGCVSFAQVKRENKSLLSYLESLSSSSNGSNNSAEELKRNFLASCAGYCVATYLLGVGDRHLDNLLLKSDGKMLHIDFGFILGEDPKPFAPPMKICREMMEVLGSVQSAEFSYFLHLCCLCFKYLRMHAHPICLLLECMATSSLKDIAKNLVRIPDKQEQHLLQQQQQQQLRVNGAYSPPGGEGGAAVVVPAGATADLSTAGAAALQQQEQQQQTGRSALPGGSHNADYKNDTSLATAAVSWPPGMAGTATTACGSPPHAAPTTTTNSTSTTNNNSSSCSNGGGRVVCLAMERVKKRFLLDYSDEEAEAALISIIINSAGSLFPAVVDRLHEWALYWK
ncbi:phosphatidylinositol 3-kinase, putative [Eimeria brunetti]|uniref:Phosphatidylinositol 3-kinase, putative n=1 Tax=Eimeria brunetti TaxID=51314 RepID=U6LXY8_9EIME|nr:phosphatidylinositol 3-kinase, putative [Eimeria brunetti]